MLYLIHLIRLDHLVHCIFGLLKLLKKLDLVLVFRVLRDNTQSTLQRILFSISHLLQLIKMKKNSCTVLCSFSRAL